MCNTLFDLGYLSVRLQIKNNHPPVSRTDLRFLRRWDKGKLTTALLEDCDLVEPDELRGAEDCEVMAVSALPEEPEWKCWAEGLRVERELLVPDCMCAGTRSIM